MTFDDFVTDLAGRISRRDRRVRFDPATILMLIEFIMQIVECFDDDEDFAFQTVARPTRRQQVAARVVAWRVGFRSRRFRNTITNEFFQCCKECEDADLRAVYRECCASLTSQQQE
jgi:hypothetical protein